MALNFLMGSQRFRDPRQRRLLIVAAVFFLAALVLYWRLFFAKQQPPTPSDETRGAAAGLTASPRQVGVPTPRGRGMRRSVVTEEALKKARLDVEILRTPLFEELRLYGSYPITVPEKGNPRLFFRKPKPTGR